MRMLSRRNILELLLLGLLLAFGLVPQCDCTGDPKNRFPTRRRRRRRRRRLDPLKDASPESNERISRLLHRLHSSHRSVRRQNLEVSSDHNNNFNPCLVQAEDEEPIPSTRRWSIQLKAPPVWICQKNNDPDADCHGTVKQEQDDLIYQLRELFPSVALVGQAHHILNSIVVELPFEAEIPANLPGVDNVALENVYRVQQVEESVLDAIGATFANSHCLTGQGVKVGILDTGVDYTHAAFGGTGTQEAYLAAYGVDGSAAASRDGLFPTAKIVQGADFLGEDEVISVEDDDPIDAHGHGTAVASAVLAVAPDVQIVAVKACITGPQATVTCPESALLQGIEFMLDPNKIGTLDEKVDIINLSLTSSFNNPYYDRTALALENAAQLGILCVTAFGNFYNIPYIAGAIGTTPNVLSVGATNQPTDASSSLYMDAYSSRGPGETNLLKPDLSAPGTVTLAVVGSGNQYAQTAGTSFSAPLVSGAAALLIQHCPMCDPLAIKCLLMNTADRNILYGPGEGEDRMAPVTRMGSGMLRLDKALNATLWAFSLEERQPSLSFGVIDAFLDIFYTKTIRISPIDSRARTLQFGYEFRNASKANVINITFIPEEVEIPANCDSSVDIQVQFYINAQLAPSNTMSTSGYAMFEPGPLDHHEFDGHLLISSVIDQEASLPFHLLVRKAAHPTFPNGTGLPFEWGPIDQNFTIINKGFGTAQIDAFELIYSDGDDEEALPQVNADIRSIGYRTIPVGEPGCEYTVEFSFMTWERTTHVGKLSYLAEIYPDGEDGNFSTLVMLEFPYVSQTYVLDNDTNYTVCTGFPTDHSSNAANTIVRACSDDLHLEDQTNFTVQFRAFAYPVMLSTSFLSSKLELSFPEPRLRAHSYDIGSFSILPEFHVQGEIGPESYGLQLVTNSFRDWDRTGAASSDTESLFLVKRGIVLESEKTPDVVIWPGLFNQTGPTCGLALTEEPACPVSGGGDGTGDGEEQTLLTFSDARQTPGPDCPPAEVPRLVVPTPNPTNTPSVYPTQGTGSPTTPRPTLAPTPIVTQAPIILPPQPTGGESSSAAATNELLICWIMVIGTAASFLAM